MIKDIPNSLLEAARQVLSGAQHPMIDVDGQMKHRHNSLGQLIHHTDEGIKNFHRWFGDSKAVDEHGRPKVMYHGTGAILTKKGTEGGIREFKTRNDLPHWVTDDPKLAHGYAGSSSTSNILPVYIKSHHPYKSDVRSDDDWAFSKSDVKNRILQQSPVQDKAALNDHIKDLFSSVSYGEHRYQSLWNAAGAATRFKNMGFDSIHHFERGANTYAVMDSNQVKSAIGNSGRFKSKSNQIDESVEEHPMIDVDGVQKHRHNSLGQPIHHTEEGIRNFHRWFGDSKAVDEHGRPQVLYHGTNQDFDSFDFDKARENGKVWLSNSPRVASNFALYRTVWNNANVLPVYVKTKSINHIDGQYENIRDIDSDIDSTEHHATVFHNVRDPVSPSIDPISDVWAVSRHAELKSALGNSGAFSHPTKITESTKVYYRGTNNKNEPDLITSGKLRPSIDHLTGKSESGVSVSDVPDVGKYFSYLYKVTGTELPRLGSDGEPLLDPKTMTFIKWIKSPTLMESEDYREEHTSPDPESGAPAHNLSSNGVYPDDFYSSKGVQYYGDGRNDDKIVHAHLKSLRNRPEADVKIYRAVPNKDEIKDINPGDWVTTNLEYAHDHGEARFSDHKVLTKNVKAKELFTDGNSFHEFGYHPVKQQHTMTDSVRRAYINMANE